MRVISFLSIACALVALGASQKTFGDEPEADPETDRNLPRLFVAGDSTAAPGGEGRVGWAVPFADYFDSEKVTVLNKARGGRSSRTFITEGHWDKLLQELEPGDVVLIQFGHNDGGAINREPPGSTRPLRARGSLPGLGDESVFIENAVTGKGEIVYTFGHYIRKMVSDVRERGGQPVLLSLTARNLWKDGRLERGSGMYGYWDYELAKELDVPFVDVTGLAVEKMEPMGSKEALDALFPKDYVHTGAEGARLHAEVVVAGLKGLRPSPVDGWLSEMGEAVEKDDPTWLNLPFPARTDLPTLFLIGDSTVRNGRGDGWNGEWGWGDYLDPHFNENRVNVVNRAVGGLSSRTFYTSVFWKRVKDMIRPGDFVMMQFGHNDNIALNDAKRARGTIKGTGEETEVIDNMVTGKREVVHTYGWYLRQFIKEARELGATPIVCSLVPRKKWNEDGTITRSPDSYAGWARTVAEQENVAFVDLNSIIADRYDALGKRAVDPLFADAHTHTSKQGAVLNARCVAQGLWALEENPLSGLMTVNVANTGNIRFALDASSPEDGIRVAKDHVYDPESGYGYDLGTSASDGAFFFSVKAEDGNYRIAIEFGDEDEASSNTVKAESRRLLLEKVETEQGERVVRSVIVNTRDAYLVPPEKYAPGGTKVALNEREIGTLHWDDKLTLEFNGEAPSVRSLSIEKAEAPTVYLIGDSTVTDQPYEPAASWGQMLPRFFKPEVAVANHAESGETMKSFISGLRLAKVLQGMKEGDYLFIQFTHNDQKRQWPQTYVEAGTTYKAYLRMLIEEARLRGATPVLVTSMQRRNFDENGKIVSTLGDYPDAMRQVAKAEKVALIDLEKMSVDLYEALGVEKAPLAFSNDGKDATHHNNYGAYELAKCVAEGIRQSKLPLRKALVDSFDGFDPKRPDDVEAFDLAESPISSDIAPLGN
ncbi:rhamnogalacturonan acetylesterase [Pelagicoccus sp. SDUM812003]|uniref:rhamnogalacturonan acetylesterase n=1 Tax=Pelagicoccus sp. SDUM812003 TaxID=3041267 RepID=UPI00280FD5D8|nr:rhamnogalacturonan acetylesterase [Pelagicoccus sp. SDUM812003]MDQ8204124.1 rhamnogalacturonan acetylesterase [Pelagicoccus sp. SDUM812003]